MKRLLTAELLLGLLLAIVAASVILGMSGCRPLGESKDPSPQQAINFLPITPHELQYDGTNFTVAGDYWIGDGRSFWIDD